ncbi:MAG: putative 2OG-Fe(II) oxygenase [Sphingorhabdus sp.]
MDKAAELFERAIRARQQQDIESAVDAIDAAQAAAPNDGRIAAVRAQLHYESWRPSAALFEQALRLIPGDLQLVRNSALALAAQGDRNGAVHLLERQLRERPEWLEGHHVLGKLRVTTGDAANQDSSLAEACQHLPASLPLHLAWFHSASLQRDWVKARRVIDIAEARCGSQKALSSARLYIASESGDDEQLTPLLGSVADIEDVGLDLCRVRLHLRKGNLREAEQVALRHVRAPSAHMFWPYLSIIWRLTDNPLARWLDGDPLFARTVDLAFSASELASLADILRSLHLLEAPYPEQSVRGGTQTDRPLFFHPDPGIQLARTRIMRAVSEYVEALPGNDGAHPLLSRRRDQLLLEGSWSVRLRDKGFHAPHTHVMGWISSAFYVQLPEQPGLEPAGWLSLGTPPPELGTELAPYSNVEPRPARLVLFPSTMWHSTLPFDAGERLTIAFDIRTPQ